MAIQDSTRVRLLWNDETTFGTDPGDGDANWNEFHTTGESLKADYTLSSSDEIKNSRGINALVQTNKSVSGSVGSYMYLLATSGLATGGPPALMAYGMGGAWTAQEVVEPATVAISSATDTYSLTAGTWDAAPAVGEWVYFSGLATDAANTWQRVETVTEGSGSSTIIGSTAVGTAVGNGDEVCTRMAFLRDGAAVKSLSFQRQYTDIAQVETFSGCVCEGFSIDATGGEYITTSFDWLGKTAVSGSSLYGIDQAQSFDGHANRVPIQMQDIGTGFVRYGAYNASGSGHTDLTNVLGFTVNVKNNLRQQYKLGLLGANATNLGNFEVTGTLQMYFENATMFDLFLNQTASGLAFCFSSGVASGNDMVIDIPSVKFTDGQRVAGGRDTDIIADMSWQGVESTIGANTYTMQLNHLDH